MTPYHHCIATSKAGGKGTSRTDRFWVCTTLPACTKGTGEGPQSRRPATESGGEKRRRPFREDGSPPMGVQDFSWCIPT